MDTTTTVRTYTRVGAAVVSRTILTTPGAMFFEITLLRTWRQKTPTYQGSVVFRDGAWCADAATTGAPVTIGRYADYLDAEAALIKRRTGLRSIQGWTGPRPIRPVRPTCDECGNELVAGACRRPYLHWSSAAQTA